MRSLVGASGLRALYPFDEGSGNSAADIVNDPLSIHIPEKYAPFQETFFHYPGDNMRIRSGWIEDFILNIFFFVPLGSLFMLIVSLRGIKLPVAGSAVAIIMACGLLSLSIEITQLYMPGRFASIMDVISNMLGAGLGIMIVLLAKKFSRTLMALNRNLQ
jgi:glycopeptide antibiotics resistance protein